MDKGKEKCEILKAIRAYVAEKYGLEYTATECTHKGDCPGTCPKWAQSEIPVHDILHKLLNLRHENLPCILDVPSRRA